MRWEAKGSERSVATWVVDEAGKRVCTMQSGDNDWERARLIAAAPELLAALKLALCYLENPKPPSPQALDGAEMLPVAAPPWRGRMGEHEQRLCLWPVPIGMGRRELLATHNTRGN